MTTSRRCRCGGAGRATTSPGGGATSPVPSWTWGRGKVSGGGGGTSCGQGRGTHPSPGPAGADTARGMWALDDIVINPTHHFEVRGAAFYKDEYVKVDGEWRIKHTGYERVYEEIQERQKIDGLNLLESWTS